MFHWKYNGHFGGNSFQAIDCTLVLETRDGPKFGRRRKECSARFGNMWLFGRTSANIRRHLWLRICSVLRSPLALTIVNILTI